MYKKHLPELLPENWKLSDLDEANGYAEFLGFDGEFLISIMKHLDEYPSDPYFLCLNQMKGILGRYDFDSLDWPEWFENPKEAMDSALKLIEWINQNYANFAPVTQYVMVSLGTEDRINSISRHFDGYITVQEFQNKRLVFRKVNLTWGAANYSEAALKAISLFYKTQGFDTENLVVGYLTNEKFQLIEDLRPAVLDQIKQRPF
ncbi:hypothetical protein [Algoriphagus aquimarinus]|uniref:Uncharacterized protein n=1 Tax=Algoriphagus aquimarinus TaxID=237018 RepID=A0A1I1AQP8_9BACT|nr:hypothetical protein [Algoriphagus aquimarinus]SFB40247.1 hypothetical protein SAMN04489723_10941 [Algoriphagus aquimarinus]